MRRLSWRFITGLTLCTLYALSLASTAMAEKFVVGYQPYDTISYQAIVNAELGLWKKYVPQGTEIEFQGALQGTVVANNMLADKAHIGYMSVMPATILCSKPEQAEIKMVATLGMSEGTRCSLVLVRKDAPRFESMEALARWMDGKVIAAPKGSASDQYLMRFFEKYNVKPKEYLNQSIEVIGTNFRIGKIDAASLWEPTLSRIADDVGEGVAHIAADGRACGNPDLGILVMRKDFMEKYPDVAKGYLRAELEAQRYLLDPANWTNVIEMVSKHASGIPKKVLWYSLYGKIPADSKETVREWKSFYFNERERGNIAEVAPFLLKDKRIKSLPPEGTVDDAMARAVVREAGITPVSDSVTLGVIEGASASASPFKE
ncbi:MAG: ABC transporter substrate-binding protein [Desulfovibrio sp.]|jgi:NitT/TauT family transport system substrate-binding protein|nr:ABC transporter substrate-binding protein [Desulfovibrio sp.]